MAFGGSALNFLLEADRPVAEGATIIKSRYYDSKTELDAPPMITEAAILAALDEPRTVNAIRQRVAPDRKDTEELQIMLMRLRDEKKVKFDINNGRWRKA